MWPDALCRGYATGWMDWHPNIQVESCVAGIAAH